MTDQASPSATGTTFYKDEDLVYVDPESKTVVGFVEWNKSGNPKPKAMPPRAEDQERGGEGRKRKLTQRFYPWGTYRSMKRIYQLEGKVKKSEAHHTLDEILPKALEQAFWE